MCVGTIGVIAELIAVLNVAHKSSLYDSQNPKADSEQNPGKNSEQNHKVDSKHSHEVGAVQNPGENLKRTLEGILKRILK